MIVVDTSVLIALLDADDTLHGSARSAFDAIWESKDEVLIPSVAYAETMVRPLELGGRPLEAAESFFDSQQVVPVDRAEAREAARLRGAHRPWLRLPDALVLATATVRGAAVLTADERWGRVAENVTVVRAGGQGG